MRQVMAITTLASATFLACASVRAQEWGGVAGVAASRGYTASSGMRITSPGGGSGPIPLGEAAPVMPDDARAVAIVAPRRARASRGSVRHLPVARHGPWNRRPHPRLL